MKKQTVGKTKSRQEKRRYRLSATTMWVTLIVFVIIFLMIRSSTHLGGSPLILFLVMFGLFFVVLFVIRLTMLRSQNWWRRTRPGLVRFLAWFVPNRRR